MAIRGGVPETPETPLPTSGESSTENTERILGKPKAMSKVSCGGGSYQPDVYLVGPIGQPKQKP